MSSVKKGRGVLYMVWGASHDHLLERSITSLKRQHPHLPVHVHRVTSEGEDLTSAIMLRHKTRMFEITPFENTLFLDADTVVLAPLDFGFEKAQSYGLACCICECPWARRYQGLKNRGDIIEYNTGVLFFTKAAQPLMYMWQKLSRTVDSRVSFMRRDGRIDTMQHNDQAAFAAAVEMTAFNPFVLPMNWNFRPRWHRSFFGPIKVWHDPSDPPRELLELNDYHADPDAVVVDVKLG